MIESIEAAVGRDVSRETVEKLQAYGSLLREENARQNLVSRATLDNFWQRHVLDSAQLARFEAAAGASWVDLGSGAGLPGIVLACIVEGPCTLVEPRRLRADFLHRTADKLRLDVQVVCAKAERLRGNYDTITARAVASLSKLFEISQHLSTGKTRWVLPKGRGAPSELAEARQTWQGVFHVEPSITDPESFIVVGAGVRAKMS